MKRSKLYNGYGYVNSLTNALPAATQWDFTQFAYLLFIFISEIQIPKSVTWGNILGKNTAILSSLINLNYECHFKEIIKTCLLKFPLADICVIKTNFQDINLQLGMSEQSENQ